MAQIIRPKEASKMLGISIPTLYRRISDPDFPPRVRIGGAVGFFEKDLNDYLEKNTELKTIGEGDK